MVTEQKQGDARGHQPFFSHVSTADARITVYNSEVRALLASSSWRDVYLASEHRVLHIDPLTSQKQPIIDLSGTVEDPHQRWDSRNRALSVRVTALGAYESMVAVGGMGGEYAFLDTSCEVGTKPTTGLLHCYDREHFVNHVALGPTRTTATPHAAYASNDGHIRVLDTGTAKVTADHKYTEPANNIAMSPDLRLWAVACDGYDAPRITSADTGEDVAHPTGASAMSAGRQSHGMTQTSCCAWADDGVTVASGLSHSRQVVVHDARKWTEPITTVGVQPSAGGGDLLQQRRRREADTRDGGEAGLCEAGGRADLARGRHRTLQGTGGRGWLRAGQWGAAGGGHGSTTSRSERCDVLPSKRRDHGLRSVTPTDCDAIGRKIKEFIIISRNFDEVVKFRTDFFILTTAGLLPNHGVGWRINGQSQAAVSLQIDQQSYISTEELGREHEQCELEVHYSGTLQLH